MDKVAGEITSVFEPQKTSVVNAQGEFQKYFLSFYK